MYWLDKEAAQGGAQRIPESTLHLVDLLGGWPGALIAQQQFRHKTVKRSFQFAFWCSVLANVAIMAWLVRSGVARSLTDAMLGICGTVRCVWTGLCGIDAVALACRNAVARRWSRHGRAGGGGRAG